MLPYAVARRLLRTISCKCYVPVFWIGSCISAVSNLKSSRVEGMSEGLGKAISIPNDVRFFEDFYFWFSHKYFFLIQFQNYTKKAVFTSFMLNFVIIKVITKKSRSDDYSKFSIKRDEPKNKNTSVFLSLRDGILTRGNYIQHPRRHRRADCLCKCDEFLEKVRGKRNVKV